MLSGTYPEAPDSGVPYQLFSSDLGGGLVSNGRRCRTSAVTQCPVENAPLPGSGAPAGYRNYYLRSGSGTFKALLSSANIGTLALDSSHFELAFAGATPDLAHVILSTCAALTPDATEVPGLEGECDPAKQNLYEKSGSSLTLINPTPGATLAAQSRAISADGSRVYWSNGTDLYLYVAGAPSPKQVDAAQGEGRPSRPPAPTAPSPSSPKANTSTATPPPAAPPATSLQRARCSACSAPPRTAPTSTTCTPAGLFLNRNGTNTLVSAQVDPESTPPTTSNARLSADGHRLLFVSDRRTQPL